MKPLMKIRVTSNLLNFCFSSVIRKQLTKICLDFFITYTSHRANDTKMNLGSRSEFDIKRNDVDQTIPIHMLFHLVRVYFIAAGSFVARPRHK